MYDEKIISNDKLQEKCEELIENINEKFELLESDVVKDGMTTYYLEKEYTKKEYIKLRKIMEILEG